MTRPPKEASGGTTSAEAEQATPGPSNDLPTSAEITAFVVRTWIDKLAHAGAPRTRELTQFVASFEGSAEVVALSIAEQSTTMCAGLLSYLLGADTTNTLLAEFQEQAQFEAIASRLDPALAGCLMTAADRKVARTLIHELERVATQQAAVKIPEGSPGAALQRDLMTTIDGLTGLLEEVRDADDEGGA